jgi:hypothetical protein
MSTLTALARAVAVSTGTAQPICTVCHVHVSPRPLVFIPLALAGEANAPLAAMAGDDPAAPALLVVPEPRDRDQRFAFAAELAAVILPTSRSRHRPDVRQRDPGAADPRRAHRQDDRRWPGLRPREGRAHRGARHSA